MKSKKVVTYDYDGSEMQVILLVVAMIVVGSKVFGFIFSFWERNYFYISIVELFAALLIVFCWHVYYSRKVSYVKEEKK